MQIDLQSLYKTPLVGSSPCHGFTHVPGHTGGFYHIVCRHGVCNYISVNTPTSCSRFCMERKLIEISGNY